ncbi:MAG: DUF5119 domain-containing protein [Bacteroidales bacterium]|nr:DUF5119 domain-containing protein [Bacteroidales bacterium]
MVKISRCLLCMLFCCIVAVSCDFDQLYTREEIENIIAEKGSAHLTFYIDWSETERPTGMTLYLFPKTGKPDLDTVPYVYHTNAVDEFSTTVPDQDYSVVCFNQSEEEFSNLKFSFSSFEDSQVIIKEESEEEKGDTKLYGSNMKTTTRGFNASGTLRPSMLSCASNGSVKSSETRGFNASGTLRPKNFVLGVNVKVNVFGLKSARAVTGTITNMSAGFKMGLLTTLPTTCDMRLADWSLQANENDSLPGTIETTFGTFGLPNTRYNNLSLSRGDTAESDTAQQSIALNLTFYLVNGDTVQFSRDLTEEVTEQFHEAQKQEEETGNPVANIDVEVGTSTEKVDPNAEYPNNVTEQGGLILPHVVNGLQVGVSDWGETNNIEIRF